MDFLIHNGSRSTKNRTLRASMPEHGGHKQYILGSDHRLVRGRPVQVTEEKLKEHLLELKEKEAKGLLYVTDLELVPIDLDTLKRTEVPVPESPRPNPRLDSAVFDKPSGEPMPMFRGDLPPPVDFTMPVAAPNAAFENNPLLPNKDDAAASEDEELERLTAPTAPPPGKRKGGR